MRRIPLWLTVVPLLIAVAGYWWFWDGYKDDFRSEIARVLPGTTVTIGGFPYRLEADVPQPVVQAGGDVTASATAERAVLNRGPWQRDLTIMRSDEPRVVAQIPGLAASALSIAAPTAESSLHVDAGRIARLSTVFKRPAVQFGLIATPFNAASLEVHFREIPGRTPEAWSPALPERAQLVLSGEGVRTAAGAPLKLAANLSITGRTRLLSYARWAADGTVEIKGLTLADATGEVVRMDATLVASGGRPRLTGTIVTPCPLTLHAALAGTRVSEQRLRLPVKLSLTGAPGAWQLSPVPQAGRAVRAQQPPCPVLR